MIATMTITTITATPVVATVAQAHAQIIIITIVDIIADSLEGLWWGGGRVAVGRRSGGGRVGGWVPAGWR